MAETRKCDQCGAAFEPRREHARFCSARCRVTWNSENSADPPAELSALGWSVVAMGEAADRLAKIRGWDRARAFGAVSEAVWWVTIVDATLVRYYPDTYDDVLAERPCEERKLVEDTLAGLRFVRNQVGCGRADFVRPPREQGAAVNGHGAGGDEAGGFGAGGFGVADWTWNSMPEPALDGLLPRGRSWEMKRYRAYQHQLAGHTIGEVFGRAATFLREAAAETIPAAGAGSQPAS
jgi:hypothetical protein